MKRTICLALAALVVPLLSLPALGADDCCPAGGAAKTAGPALAAAADPHAGMDMGGSGTARIHEGKKDGFTFTYDILPMTGEGATHHLMVFVRDPSGRPLTGAKVGFDVAPPAAAKRKDQKVMAMGMGDGYGANLDLAPRGKYIIRTKVVGGAANLLYSFEYEVR